MTNLDEFIVSIKFVFDHDDASYLLHRGADVFAISG